MDQITHVARFRTFSRSLSAKPALRILPYFAGRNSHEGHIAGKKQPGHHKGNCGCLLRWCVAPDTDRHYLAQCSPVLRHSCLRSK